MPEEIIVSSDVKSALDSLQQDDLHNHISKTKEYELIQRAVETGEILSVEDIVRLLALCVHDLRQDMKYTVNILKILNALIPRIKERTYDLMPSALAIIYMLKTTGTMYNLATLQLLCFDTIMMYPGETLISLMEPPDDIVEIIQAYCHVKVCKELRAEALNFLHILLKILPPPIKHKLIEKGISVWFSHVIPTLTSDVVAPEVQIEILELLTEQVIQFDYSDDPYWFSVLESICSSKSYPAIMKKLLENGSGLWHRLWIVFIRLLKNQLTQPIGKIGTPINSMLPIVEAAFKGEIGDRCKAFECWNVVIDSFYQETNDTNIKKRLSLLMIPLTSNNAKVEETALAKFKCWWHLLRTFQDKIDRHLDNVLLSFLRFCFGRHNVDRAQLIPGQLSPVVKKLCVQSMVDIVGHVNCEGCTELIKLNNKYLTAKQLVDNWAVWLFCLCSTITITGKTDILGFTKQQMTCMWKSFLFTLCEIQDTDLKKNMISDIVAKLESMVEDAIYYPRLADFIFNTLLLSFFEELQFKQLLKVNSTSIPSQENQPLYKILKFLMDSSLESAYPSNLKELLTLWKPVTDTVMDPTLSVPPSLVIFVVKKLPRNNFGLMIWTALAESITESQYELFPQILGDVLEWPIICAVNITDFTSSALPWYKLYELLYTKFKAKTFMDAQITQFLNYSEPAACSMTMFKICVLLAVLKRKLVEESGESCVSEVELLRKYTNDIDSYEAYEQVFPILIERISAVIEMVIIKANEIFTQHILFCIKKILQVMVQACKEQTNISVVLPLIENILQPLVPLFNVGSYSELIPVIADDILEHYSFLTQHESTKRIVMPLMKTFMSKMKKSSANFSKIKAVIDEAEGSPNVNKTTENTEKRKPVNPDKDKFTTPTGKEVKKAKKKEPSIVNTVVENGEEYVVVKSNWKFNPRKLTENQKEKLQRKREDIPALYQDLSQSQDEFKLTAWKTDSQDTSNSSRSESVSNKTGDSINATEMLKNLPSSNVVPKILESFLSENDKKTDNNGHETSLNGVSKNVEATTPKSVKTPNNFNKKSEATTPKSFANNSNDASKKLEPTIPKNTKSPRMALKDRVFRNVRNLMEKSEVQKENKNAPEDLNKTVNVIKTPTQAKSTEPAEVNSAPPLLSADRPSRVKRKPKKFDELLILGIKKRRQSFIASNPTDEPASPVAAKTFDVPTENNKNEVATSVPPNNVKDNEVAEKSNDIQPQVTEKQKVPKVVIQDFVKSPKKNDSEKVTEKATETDKNIDILEKKINNLEAKILNSINEKMDTGLNNKIVEKTTNLEKTVVQEDKSNQGSEDKNKEENAGQLVKDSVNNNDEDTTISKETKEISTPQPKKTTGNDEPKSTSKKTARRSRIEKELAIDMVEGNPVLNVQSEKRLTRKALEANTGRRRGLAEKLNKSKTDTNNGVAKLQKKTRDKNRDSDSSNSSSVTVEETQETNSEKDQSSFSQEIPYSDDVIESSQDSSVTSISVKSTKKNKKVPVITIEKIKLTDKEIAGSQSILENAVVNVTESPSKVNQDSKDDIELPLNKTALEEKTAGVEDLTENMDTEPVDDNDVMGDVVVVNNDSAPMTISSEEVIVGPETQEIAEADTQPTDPKDFMDVDAPNITECSVVIESIPNEVINISDSSDNEPKEKSPSDNSEHPVDNTTMTLSESACATLEKENGASSPSTFNDEEKRKQDFMNNTLEISPIKNMSPDRNKKSPSPETSSDYVVIKLTSPVNSNGEPIEKCGSPEVFTEDKTSPDKRDQSPPRVEVAVTNTSPSSSLSLKKNRPQVRAGGRAAQMLGLCVPDKVQAVVNPEKNDQEEAKNTVTSNTPARRNLRMLYSAASENAEATNEEDGEPFLKFKRNLPAVDCSPSGPILKRKLVEISDEATVSPASKRKRVSFHDPPVSTTVSVQKYIEPACLRSPQNSAIRRQERQLLRQQTPSKSPKRLDHSFKLDTELTKAVESFSETEVIATPDDTQPISLDETPVVEIVRASELNDTDPICPALVDCKDPIDNIASQLSSSAMKSLLVLELTGKVETVGDLAKMTELEVNRLCIKAPKVKVARRVLTDYLAKKAPEMTECDVTLDVNTFNTLVGSKGLDRNVQTDIKITASTAVQTDESGSKTTADLIKSCLEERPDFVDQVGTQLQDTSIRQIAEKLPVEAVTDLLMNKLDTDNSKSLLNRILEYQSKESSENSDRNKLSFIRDYMCNRFSSQDLILFCSEVLKSVYDKPA